MYSAGLPEIAPHVLPGCLKRAFAARDSAAPDFSGMECCSGVCCQRRSQCILTSCGGRRDLSKKPGRGVHPQAGRHSTRSGTGRAEQCVPQWTSDWIVGISPGFGRDHAEGAGGGGSHEDRSLSGDALLNESEWACLRAGFAISHAKFGSVRV